MVNLGGEGQLVLGGITAAVVAASVDLPMPLSLVAALAAGALAGGLLGTVPAVLENRLGVPLLVSSLLLSYPVVALASYVVRFPLRDPGTGLPQSRVFEEAYRMPVLYGVGLSAVDPGRGHRAGRAGRLADAVRLRGPADRATTGGSPSTPGSTSPAW